MFLFDFIAELGLVAVKDRALEADQQKKVKDTIKSFLEREAKYNELASREEEIDFEGLYKYIADHLEDDVKARLFGSMRERFAATQTILAKAVAYAKARTPESVQRTKRIISKALDILSRFYRSKVNRELLFLSTEIIDSVEEICEKQHKEQTREIAESIFENLIHNHYFQLTEV